MGRNLFIDGTWIAPSAGETLCVIDPATEKIIDRVAAGTAADVNRAVDAADRAYAGPWASTRGRDRAEYLRAFAVELVARRDELAKIEVLDNGKPLPEAVADVNDGIACFEYYAGLADALETSRLLQPI